MKETTAGSQGAPGQPQMTGQVRRMDDGGMAAAGPAAVQGTAGPAADAPLATRGSHRSSSPPGWLAAGVPLAVVLVAQLLLSLRLVRADTAFQDEAAYLWAGHLQWAHWLHGAPVPHFPAYFSGAPVIYPPIGALADSVGGLAAARELSLVFMLGATALLWATTSPAVRAAGRILRRGAVRGAGPDAAPGGIRHLRRHGDVLCGAGRLVRGPGRTQGDATGWMVAAGIALAVANATAYSSALFDLIVIGLALLTAFPAPARQAVRRGLILLATVAVACGAGLLIGGSAYLDGIERTTFLRAGGTNSPLTVLNQSMVVDRRDRGGGRMRRRSQLARGAPHRADLAAGAPGLRRPARPDRAGPSAHHRLAEQARGPGCLVRGHRRGLCGGQVHRRLGRRAAEQTSGLRCLRAGAGLSPLVGDSQSRAFATSWPNSFSFTAILRPLAGHSSGRLLVEDPSIAEYYLPAGSQWQRWSSTRNIVLPGGASTGGPEPGQVWSVPATRASSPSSSPTATSPTSRSTSLTPPPSTTASPPNCTTTPTITSSMSCRTAQIPQARDLRDLAVQAPASEHSQRQAAERLPAAVACRAPAAPARLSHLPPAARRHREVRLHPTGTWATWPPSWSSAQAASSSARPGSRPDPRSWRGRSWSLPLPMPPTR